MPENTFIQMLRRETAPYRRLFGIFTKSRQQHMRVLFLLGASYRMNNPYATPTVGTSQAEQPTVVLPENIPAEHTFLLKGKFDGFKGDWHLALTDDAAYLYANPSKCFMISRGGAWGKVSRDLLTITLTANGETQGFSFVDTASSSKKNDVRIIDAWVGPPSFEDLKKKLGGASIFLFSLGVLCVLSALPVPADPANQISAAPLDYFGIIIGSLLIFGASLRQFKPSRYIFLSDAILFLIYAVSEFINIANGSSRWFVLFAGFLLLLCQHNLRHFFRFKTLRGDEYRYEPLEHNTTKTSDDVSEATSGNQFRERFKGLSS